jgi:hypothetical protein
MELWLPWMKIAAPAIFSFAVIWIAHRYKGLRQRRSTETIRVASIVVAAPLVALSLFLLSAQGCEEDRVLVGSPDGRHVARMMIWGSVPTGTSLQIIERHSWSPQWQVVSSAATVGTLLDPIEPKVIWIDNSHLLLDYPEASEGSGFDCTGRKVGDIWLICKTHK